MTRYVRWTIPLTLTLVLGLILQPGEMMALDTFKEKYDVCEDDYMACLNENWDRKGLLRFALDVACLTEFTNCVLLYALRSA